MKTPITLLIFLTATGLSNDGLAQAVAPPESAPPTAANAVAGVVPAGSVSRAGRAQYGAGSRGSIPGAMAGGGGYAVSWSTARPREISKFPLIHFSQPDTKTQDALTEDLNVMSLLLEQSVERAVGENSPTYRMGIPMMLPSGARSVEASYIEDFGVLFGASVNFPLFPPPVPKEKETEPTTRSDDWENARQQLLGHPTAVDAYNQFASGRAAYDAEQVAALKRGLLGALKNAANIRRLKPDEFVVVTITGTDNVVTTAAELPAIDGYATTHTPMSGRSTALTIRVKKSDAEAFSKGRLDLEQFQQKANINAYVGALTGGAAWQTTSYPGNTPSAAGVRR